jgi:pimeloyl-ACP methyl ester carboxylesterase
MPHRLSERRAFTLPVGDEQIEGTLTLPPEAPGIVVFVHGSGSSRHSPRNREVAAHLVGHGLGTLLVDLLTPGEEQQDLGTRELRFDIGLLAERVGAIVEVVADQPGSGALPIGLFGASTGAAAALVTAAERPERVVAVVSRGGRTDLAGEALGRVRAPTLLIVGGDDPTVLELNREALSQLRADRELEIVPGAGHLFEEPGALERVAVLAAAWLTERLPAGGP